MAYRKIHTRKAEVETGKVQIEKEMLDLQSHMAMLQCQNWVLPDQVSRYQTVSEKAAVHVAKYKLSSPQREQVNQLKVQVVLAHACPDWDPATWDGDIWDNEEDDEYMDDDDSVEKSKEGALCQAQLALQQERWSKGGHALRAKLYIRIIQKR